MTYASITPYADATYGDAYFADRLRSEAWDDASSADKAKALKQATRAIDRLSFAGDKAVATQPMQFPRGADVAVPDEVLQATCELALALLDDVDPNMEIENLSTAKQRFGDFQSERDTSMALEHISAGIPSIQAWALLQPFLRDPKILDVDRS